MLAARAVSNVNATVIERWAARNFTCTLFTMLRETGLRSTSVYHGPRLDLTGTRLPRGVL